MPLHDEIKNGHIKIIRKQYSLSSCTSSPADNSHPQGYAEVKWNLIEILDLR